LRALVVGLLALGVATQAAAAATQAKAEPTTPRGATSKARAETADELLERKLAALRKYRGTVRFFQRHRAVLASKEHGSTARSKLAYSERRVLELTRAVRRLRGAIRRREARRLASLSPRAAICGVFGSYCREAVAVAWCESRLRTTARNGQYLGLFQMGASERELFGHGSSADEQAAAAHRYFVHSGRDWSPWGCRWAAT